MSITMDGKVAIITGGGSGIGRAAAIKFAENGARVVVANRTIAKGKETVGLIKSSGGEAIFVRTDVSKSSDVQALVDSTIAAYKRLDYAFNNAGYFPGMVPLSEYTEEMWDHAMNINCKGVWLCMKYEIPRMLEIGGGAIVNTSSVAGLVGIPNHYGYTASKYGVNGVTKVAAMEFAQSGIRVNAVCPAVVETPMGDYFCDPESRKLYEPLHPIGRYAKPQEVAATAVWLCSDEASYITGQLIAVDGGWTIP